MTRHETHDAFASRDLVNRQGGHDSHPQATGSQKMLVAVLGGTILFWGGVALWVVL